jgi:hypothetical protein
MTYADFAERKQRYIDMLEFRAANHANVTASWSEEDLRRTHKAIVGTEKGWSILEVPTLWVWERHYSPA